MAKRIKVTSTKIAKAYEHAEKGVMRPEVGLQSEFRTRKPPTKYRYDPSLDPELSWDVGTDRERAEALIRQIREAKTLEEARSYAEGLIRMSGPFLKWTGKAERGEFEIPTLPLFVHERLSTKAILESLRGHRPQQTLDLFGDSGLDITDRVLKAYEHPTPWTNRLILGDSLVVMNSLLQYEGLGGQVQMIYMDPPYGVKFGSNFQPFVRRRNVDHASDASLTREPEMIQAYRDTWELGVHSYLTYLRERILVCRDLLHPTGSMFLQISDDNLHRVRQVLDEIFGSENFVSQVAFFKTGAQTAKALASNVDFLLWYAKDKDLVKFHQLFLPDGGWVARAQDIWVEHTDGRRERFAGRIEDVPPGDRLFAHRSLESTTGSDASRFPIEFEGKTFRPSRGWSTSPDGIQQLIAARRIIRIGERIRFVAYLDDFPFSNLTSVWSDTGAGSFLEPNIYVVQTVTKVVQRCMLMSTDPGDLVLDPTCGSGTTAYVAERWGRRWITLDTSRVPLALVRQRLLTATLPYYELNDGLKGPSSGFVYNRKRNKKGEEIGGIVPHVTLRSIAVREPPAEELLVDRPEESDDVVRVSGTFTVEAVTPLSEARALEDGSSSHSFPRGEHVDRVIAALSKASTVRFPGGTTIPIRNVHAAIRSLDLHAEGESGDPTDPHRIAIVVGPPDGPVTETLVFKAAKEANVKGYSHLYAVGFAIEDAATKLIQNASVVLGIPTSYVNASLDILMGDGGWDLLKTTRASEVFSITGFPDIQLQALRNEGPEGDTLYQVHLLGVDVFDPVAMEVHHKKGDDVPAWLLDTDYNELAFWVSQAFFPKTGAWDNLRRELKGAYREEVWDHLAGTTSAPFSAGKHKRIAVKVIDERGNELLVVKNLSEAEAV